MGFKGTTANWKTSLKGEAKAGAGGGCDPQKPHCAPDPRAVLHSGLRVWKHHRKRDKRHFLKPSPSSPERWPALRETLSWDSCAEQEGGGSSKEVGECLSLTVEGAETEGSCLGEANVEPAQQRLSPWLWPMIQGMGMDWMDCLDTDIQVATATCPQGPWGSWRPHCRWGALRGGMSGLGLLSPRGKRRGGPKDSPRVERAIESPKLQRESRNSEEMQKIQKLVEGSEGVLVLSHLAGHPEYCCCQTVAEMFLEGHPGMEHS